MKTISPAKDHPASHRATGRAAAPATRGFGTVIKQAHALQSFIESHLRSTRPTEISSALETQRPLISSGLALIERCCATLPHPARFRALIRISPTAGSRPEEGQSGLAHIVAQHLSLRGGIDALAEQRTEEEPGELLLAQAARNHAKMAWTLAALLRNDETGREHTARSGEDNWENEGGASEFNPAIVRSLLLPTSF